MSRPTSEVKVTISPTFITTQTGSSALNSINNMFSCPAGLTSFLLVQDDDDFEAILFKRSFLGQFNSTPNY